MKKMLWASALTLTFVAGLTACSDSSSSGPDQTQTSGLPATCEAGEQAFAEGVSYTCIDGGWAPTPADNPGTPADNPGVASSTSTTPASTNSNTAKSSTSTANSVNSGTASSSSVAVTAKCGDETYEVGYLFCDERDNTLYGMIPIGSQVWLGQNLNYETENSFCYDNDPENCKRFGRLYTWTDATDTTDTDCGLDHFCGIGQVYSVKGICPDGWHLPAPSEWDALVAAVGGETEAATALRIPDWGGFLFENPTAAEFRNDEYHFSAFPSGFYSGRNKKFYQDGFHMWLRVEYTKNSAWTVYLATSQILQMEGYKTDGYSIRCVLDK